MRIIIRNTGFANFAKLPIMIKNYRLNQLPWLRHGLLLSVIFLLMPLLASAISFRVNVDVASQVKLVTNDGMGRTIDLQDGWNDVEIADTENPVLLSCSDTGRVVDVFYNDTYLLGTDGAYRVPIKENDTLEVYSMPYDGTVSVAFNGESDMVEVTTDGQPVEMGEYVKYAQGSVFSITNRDGYVIDEVFTTPESDVVKNGDVYTVTANFSMSVTIIAREDIPGNLNINVDYASNVVVTDKMGKRLTLQNGDNYLMLDIPAASPLSIKATEKAELDMVVVNDDFCMPDDSGVATANLNADGFNRIYIMTLIKQKKTIMVNVDHAEMVKMTDAQGNIISLSDGTNEVELNFDEANPITLEKTEVGQLVAVEVDGYEETIIDGKVSFYVYPGSVVSIVTQAGGTIGATMIADEDFSGLTEGSEDSPALDVQLLDEKGWFMDTVVLKPYNPGCTKTWGGDKLYPAGGALAVMKGFLNTPVGDYSGDLKMTFRAKLLPGQTDLEDKGVDILLIRHDLLKEYKRTTVTLTEEWQEFTFTADNGWYNNCKIQFFTMTDKDYLLDDIRIEHKINGIEPPKAERPSDMDNDSFTAHWTTTDTADDYLISVYTKTPSGKTIEVSEDFEGLSTDASGNIIGMPEGWEYNLSANGSRRQLSVDSALASSGQNAISFDSKGDYIVTPISEHSVKSFSMELIIDTSDERFDPNNLAYSWLAVNALTDSGWQPWMNISVPALVNMEGHRSHVDLTENIGLFENIYGFRIESAMADDEVVIVNVDDVMYSADLPAIKNYLWEDKSVGGRDINFIRVEDENFDTEADYFYSLKSQNTRYVSASSNEMEVFNVHIPEAAEATDITDQSFTASWLCGGKADAFRIDLHRKLVATEDSPNAVVLKEDFSRILSNGTPEEPEAGRLTVTTVSLDGLTNLNGWEATSYTLGNNMIGGFEEIEGYLAGSITTPEIDLSNNGGACTVQVRAYFTAGDGLVIQGLNAACIGVYPYDETGWKTFELPLQYCGDKEKLAFYSYSYKPFMIDEITITQNLKKGDIVKMTTDKIRVNDREARSRSIEDIRYNGGLGLSYDVTALRYYQGNPLEEYSSRTSNEVDVRLLPSSVENITSEPLYSMEYNGGVLTIMLDAASQVELFRIDGTIVARFHGNAGANSVRIESGIYIVRIDGKAMKIRL